MNIEVNDVLVELAGPTTLLALLQTRTATTRGSAVAVDGEVIPRAQWAAFELDEGQRVELVTAVQGG